MTSKCPHCEKTLLVDVDPIEFVVDEGFDWMSFIMGAVFSLGIFWVTGMGLMLARAR